jgi:hypothetical protein
MVIRKRLPEIGPLSFGISKVRREGKPGMDLAVVGMCTVTGIYAFQWMSLHIVTVSGCPLATISRYFLSVFFIFV